MAHQFELAQELLNIIREKYPALPSPVLEAFKKVPRHLFVDRFSVDGEKYMTMNKENLAKHLPLIYSDTTLLLYSDEVQTSTISQPSLVLKMLSLLDLRPGQKVFELGAGSGWNAALMGEMVGPEGKVVSLEIIDEMAIKAQQNLQKLSLPQVKILAGDAVQGFQDEAPFDRGIFTAGARDLPHVFYDQIRDGGKLLFVLKLEGNSDILLVLRKTNGHFEEEERLGCIFVPVTGVRAPQGHWQLEEVRHSRRVHIYPKGDTPEVGENKKLVEGESNVYVLF